MLIYEWGVGGAWADGGIKDEIRLFILLVL